MEELYIQGLANYDDLDFLTKWDTELRLPTQPVA